MGSHGIKDTAPPNTCRPCGAMAPAAGIAARFGLWRLVSQWRRAFQRPGVRASTREAERRGRVGRWGERQAERLLVARGMRILGRRVRVGRRDEIDLVARDGTTLVFVEVKTRKSEQFGRPASAVHRGKRHAQSRAAMRYIARLREKPPTLRFDVVEVVGEPGGEPPVVRHLANAFPLDTRYRVRW